MRRSAIDRPEAMVQLAALVLAVFQAAATAPAESPATPRKPVNPPPAGPFVAFEVTQGRAALGTIVIGLYPDKAPITVENFLQYVRAGHYEGTIFHRVIPGFMVQAGGYTPEMEEKPTRPAIRNEAKNGLRNSRAAVAMARVDAPDSATSQFFINLRDNHRLDFGIGGAGYAVFGMVVQGMDIVDRISTVPTTRRGEHENVPELSVLIRSAREVPAPAMPPAVPADASQPKP
jgi:cyclophilin family peptidyl-prolyl cis-trans isomerase